MTKPFIYFLSCAIIAAGLAPIALNAQTPKPASPTAAAPQEGAGKAALKQGRALLKRGNAEQALGHLEQALKLYTTANDAKGIAASRDALGDLYSRQGQHNVALTHYQKANESFVAANDTYNANLMLAKTGDMLYSVGRGAEARDAYSRMTVPKIDISTTGKIKQVMQKVDKGLDLFNKGREVVASGLAPGTVGKATALAADVKTTIDQERADYRQYIIFSIYELGMGRLDYSGNQLDSAKTHFSNALAAADNTFYGKFGQARRWRIASRTSLGDIALLQSRFSDAIKHYNSASDGARKDKRADLRWPAQRGVGKSKWLQAGIEKDRKKATKIREEAIVAYRDAVKTIEAIRAGSISADESRTTFLATTKDVFDEAAGALAERALMAATPGQPLSGAALADAAEAFKIVEQGRARSLLDMLGEANANLSEGVPADLLKRRQDNLSRQQEIAQELAGFDSFDEENKKSDSDLEAELNQLSIDYDSIENQIRTANPRYASLTLPQPLTLAEVQQQVLDDKTALLEYSLGAHVSYLWAVTQGGVALYKLPAREIVEKQALEFRAAMIPEKLRSPITGINLAPTRGLGLSSAPASGNAGGFATTSNTLYRTAVEPAASMIGDKRMLIVADGALNYIPFEALVKTGGGTDYAALPYLVTSNEIAYAPSASVVAVIRKQASARPQGTSVLVIADPIFSSNDPRLSGATKAAAKGGGKIPAKRAPKAAAKGAGRKTTTPVAPPAAPAPNVTANAETRGLGLSNALADVAGTPSASGTGAPIKNPMLARLNGTRAEAEQIAALTKQSGGTADIWLDLNANEANVQSRDLRNYRVVHVATHGLLNAERPQFTGLVLSLVGNKAGDGFLRTDEIFNLKLGAPLVMLSACETGLGKEKRGEGVIGLTRAFMYAGAPTVGVSLWSVSDNSTAQLMTDFYKRMLTGQGMSASAAMRGAQQNMIAGKKYAAPFYWAP
ncbi:MAG: CHAT domain-containing protein, partial [Pyrinomonadaceae bacterium]|nr:CHAT domain-containing protein [Pyrinomonadaceae bacterium]